MIFVPLCLIKYYAALVFIYRPLHLGDQEHQGYQEDPSMKINRQSYNKKQA